MDISTNQESGGHGLHELRCLHELARQLLPLSNWREVARDGLLCIAGITGIGAGAVLWRARESGPFDLLSHFGLDSGRFRQRYRIPIDAQGFLMDSGPVTLEAVRRRALGRILGSALEPLVERIAEAWVLPLHGERGLRGIVLLGPSLVTQTLLGRPGWLADLAEVLRLALVGSPRRAGADEVRQAAVRRHPGAAESAPRTATGGRTVVARLRSLRRAHPQTAELVGESPALLAVLEEIVSLAGTDYTVLIEGDTGTGKELAAHLLHRLSRRAEGPFEAVDCSAIPQELIESELFGHEKGAFTGATRNFRGAFERADGGTLLLDEIGDMDLRSQTRFLRVLQEGHVRRLGGDRPVPVDVRVIAATNRDLADLVRSGQFREDLYYRIHVCPLPIPAVRERADDRLVLFKHFMQQHAAELDREPRQLAPASRRRLRVEEFPGNVRQLQNVVRQLLVRPAAGGLVEVEELERVLDRSTSLPRRQQASGVAPPAFLPELPAGPGAPAGPERLPPRPQEVPQAADTAPERATVELAAVEDVGAWVLEQVRAHRFNLLAAAKHLQALRRNGASRQVVPVFDRGALDYYLCGEFFRRLVEHGFDVEGVVGELAGSAALVPRVRRKVRAFLRPLSALDARRPDAARVLLRESYRRIPERYHVDLQQALEALQAGRWKV
ncbi:MAG: sigma 54-interacting transcriptional regulator [Candidatus Krumholzibacteriia bacterium]